MPELIAPDVRWHAAWLDAHVEWGPGVHEDGFGLAAEDEVESGPGFEAWVVRLTEADCCVYRWIVEGDRMLGGIAMKLECGEFGHIGYGIRPSARRRGLGTWALGRMLGEARNYGLERVVLVCAADNVASARTIERNGGVLEGMVETDLGRARRYVVGV
ncbi:GNAT family N-acetyltransferase [Nocardia sp. NPDC050413]|uniref:GNAT family N-acetyltransferase n=1 Tax=Nocardia sp. NPDC050413 TaxID=3155784 RepID=UPI0034114E46